MPLLVKRSSCLPVTVSNGFLLPLGHGLFCLVDYSDYVAFSRYRYRLHKSSGCYYAARKHVHDGVQSMVFLHREISRPGPDEVVHHKNRFTLDCRRCNLENLSPSDHRLKHFLCV